MAGRRGLRPLGMFRRSLLTRRRVVPPFVPAMPRSVVRRYRLVVLTLPLFALPAWEYRMLAADVDGYVERTGTVVGHAQVQPRFGFPRFQSIIEYDAPDGRRRRLVDPRQKRPAESIGQRVPVLVHPTQPMVAVRGGLGGHRLPVAGHALTALGMAGVGLGAAWFSHRHALGRLRRARAGSSGRRSAPGRNE